MTGIQKYIAVVGAGEHDEETSELAREVGRLAAEAGAVVVCGGLGGVMEAACRGARQAGGTTLGILPGLDRREANAFVDHAICTGIGQARNLAVVASGDAVIAIGGEFGTLSEIALARKSGRPVFLLESWDIRRHDSLPAGVVPVSSPEEAVRLALG